MNLEQTLREITKTCRSRTDVDAVFHAQIKPVLIEAVKSGKSQSDVMGTWDYVKNSIGRHNRDTEND